MVARIYYHASKRFDEMRWSIFTDLMSRRSQPSDIREGRMVTPREHVEHFIATPDGRSLVKQINLFRLADDKETEKTLRACQQM